MNTKTYQELKADAIDRNIAMAKEHLDSLKLSNNVSTPSYNSILGRRKWVLKNGRWKKVLI